jgi:RES domain-containing protein
LTPDDRVLGADVLHKNQPLTLYRLAIAKYANLSGVGAALFPGRWNRSGQEAIYTSTEQSTTVLERLVHMPKDSIPSNQALMTIRVSGNWTKLKSAMMDPHTGGTFEFYRTLAHAKRAFSSGLSINSFAVAVPSVIVSVWNVVLYPQGVGFWDHVALEAVEHLDLDSRLFPDGTPIEIPE